RMITNVLPQLDAQASDAPPGYAPTALSASSRPAAPSARPGETALDFGSADQALAKDPSAERTGSPAGVQAQAAQTTPSSAQPGQGDPPRYEPSAAGWGPGYAAPAGYTPSGSAGAPAGYAPGGSAAPPAGYAPGGSAGSAARPEGGQGDFSSWYDPAPGPGRHPVPDRRGQARPRPSRPRRA